MCFFPFAAARSAQKVFTGTGVDRKAAWLSAYDQTKASSEENYSAVWLKADLMSEAKTYDPVEFSTELHHYRPEFFRYGIAFDKNFETALLEAELNGSKILDYENECVDESYLNTYLKKPAAAHSLFPAGQLCCFQMRRLDVRRKRRGLRSHK